MPAKLLVIFFIVAQVVFCEGASKLTKTQVEERLNVILAQAKDGSLARKVGRNKIEGVRSIHQSLVEDLLEISSKSTKPISIHLLPQSQHVLGNFDYQANILEGRRPIFTLGIKVVDSPALIEIDSLIPIGSSSSSLTVIRGFAGTCSVLPRAPNQILSYRFGSIYSPRVLPKRTGDELVKLINDGLTVPFLKGKGLVHLTNLGAYITIAPVLTNYLVDEIRIALDGSKVELCMGSSSRGILQVAKPQAGKIESILQAIQKHSENASATKNSSSTIFTPGLQARRSRSHRLVTPTYIKRSSANARIQ
jgi:hypothetical protein